MIQHSDLTIGMTLEATEFPHTNNWKLAKVLQIFDRKQDVGDNLSLTWVEVEFLVKTKGNPIGIRYLSQLRKISE